MNKAEWAEVEFKKRWDGATDAERSAAWVAHDRFWEMRTVAADVTGLAHFHDLDYAVRVAWMDAVTAGAARLAEKQAQVPA